MNKEVKKAFLQELRNPAMHHGWERTPLQGNLNSFNWVLLVNVCIAAVLFGALLGVRLNGGAQ